MLFRFNFPLCVNNGLEKKMLSFLCHALEICYVHDENTFHSTSKSSTTVELSLNLAKLFGTEIFSRIASHRH